MEFLGDPFVKLVLLLIALTLLVVFNILTTKKEAELARGEWSLDRAKKLLMYRGKLISIYFVAISLFVLVWYFED